MFKATSQNMVSRDRRAVTQNQRNMNGIDESVFFNAYEKELKRLGAEKKATEIEISKYNEMIKTASITAQARGQYVNTQVFIGWQTRKGDAKKRLYALERALIDLKTTNFDRVQESRNLRNTSFDTAFKKAAKQMLAGPVYDRIVVAATHMMADPEDGVRS